MLRTITFMLFTATVHYSVGQALSGTSLSMENDRITWKVSGVIDSATGHTTSTRDFFKTSPDSIFWLHDGGAAVERLHIDNKDQSWPDVREDGNISFQVTWRNIAGTIAFRRAHGEATITTQFYRGKTNVAPYTYTVESVIAD